MSEKTLKFDNIRRNKKKIYKSKQPINLDLEHVDPIVISEKFRHNDDGFKYFFVTEKVRLLNRFELSHLKLLDTKNILKTDEKTCLSWLKMMMC